MTQQTPGQARVVDPILTTHAIGYMRPGNVGKFLFPNVDVATYGGKVLTFGKEGFRRYNTQRSPGENIKRVQFGYQAGNYAIVPRALEAVVPVELATDAANGPGIDASSDAVDLVLDIMQLEHECQCADIARAVGNYDNDHKTALVGTARWKGAAADPTADVVAGKEAIRSTIGVRPNTAVLSASAFSALQSNEALLDRLKYTGRDSVTTDILARLWEIQNVYVGEAVVATGQNDSLGDVWGDDVILAFVAPPSGGNRRNAARPSYGYTYTIRGMPNVRQAYFENNNNSWIHQVQDDEAPVLTGVVAGYLIQNAGAAPA